ncbi:hypothetical protein vseg_018415 [Gypsophila vaccaria]
MANSADVVDDSNLVDPLADYSPFSFNISSSFRHLANATHHSLVSHLKNLAVRNPDSFVNQGKAIKEGAVELLENDAIMDTVNEDQNVVPVTINDENPCERRPALGLRPAKFKLKPLQSLPDICPEPTIDFDNLDDDPVELFATFERMENAKKELRRLRGLPPEDDQDFASLQPGALRPTIWGKTVKYKHRSYPSIGVPDKDEPPLLSSQEANDQRIVSSTHEDVIPEIDAKNNSAGVRVSDVKMATRSKVSELDELLSLDFDGLDEDGVQRLLQDQLNIKPVDIRKLSLPDMPDILCSRESLPKRTDTLNGMHDSTNNDSSNLLNFRHQFKKSLSSNLVSPSLPKSPLASISSLSKHFSRISQSKDPYLHLDIGSSLGVSTSSETRNRKQADQIGKNTDSHDFSRFDVNGEQTNRAVTSPPGVVVNSTIRNDGSEEQLDRVGHSKDSHETSKNSHEIERSPASREEIITIPEIMPSPIAMDTTPADDPEECLYSPADGGETLPVSGETPLAIAATDVDPTSALIEQEDQIAADPELVGKESLSKGSAVEKASVDGVNKRRKEEVKSNAPVQKEPKNKKRKVGVPPRPSMINEKLRRHSLYGAGTQWEAGLRRSTRIRMRPLEFWRGERFLYGRVHKSVVSVIGVKYASPTKNAEEPAVKVKSFVSSEHKNLLDLASSH